MLNLDINNIIAVSPRQRWMNKEYKAPRCDKFYYLNPHKQCPV